MMIEIEKFEQKKLTYDATCQSCCDESKTELHVGRVILNGDVFLLRLYFGLIIQCEDGGPLSFLCFLLKQMNHRVLAL